MISIEKYISDLLVLLIERFGSRLVYVGLQGSYLRGEATDDSDIDMMVVIDNLQVADLEQYRSVIETLEHFDKSCGFICGKTDLASWNPLEICHLVHTTKDYWGTLCDLVPVFADEDIRNFVKISVNNLYHEICHRYIHSSQESNIAAISQTYKAVFFILQNITYLEQGLFAATKKELLPLLRGKDCEVLKRSLALNSGATYDFQDNFNLLFTWCQEKMTSQ